MPILEYNPDGTLNMDNLPSIDSGVTISEDKQLSSAAQGWLDRKRKRKHPRTPAPPCTPPACVYHLRTTHVPMYPPWTTHVPPM